LVNHDHCPSENGRFARQKKAFFPSPLTRGGEVNEEPVAVLAENSLQLQARKRPRLPQRRHDKFTRRILRQLRQCADLADIITISSDDRGEPEPGQSLQWKVCGAAKHWLELPQHLRKNASFSQLFPMFVPSLSWQKNPFLVSKWRLFKALFAPGRS
jgi:hypothetical protein